MPNKSANTQGKQPRRKAPRSAWKPGQSGNPKGAPRRGESWAEILKRVGEMTPSDAASRSLELSKQLLTIGDGVTLKEAIVLRVYGAMIFDPDARLFNAIMDRAEGKVAQTVNIIDARNKIVDLLRRGELQPAAVELELGHDLATELFVAAGVPTSQVR